MTEHELRTEPTTAVNTPSAADGPYGPDRWHRRGRPFRFAAIVVALAGIVFIIAVIFWSGFVLGVCTSGHHGHAGGGFRHESMSSLYASESPSEIVVTG